MGVGKIAIVSGVPHSMLHDEHNWQVMLFPLVTLSLGVVVGLVVFVVVVIVVVVVFAVALAGFPAL